VHGIFEQKVTSRSNWVGDEDEADAEAVSHVRLWHAGSAEASSERKMLAAAAGTVLHIWNIDKNGECLLQRVLKTSMT
jgi:hypothetical protein